MGNCTSSCATHAAWKRTMTRSVTAPSCDLNISHGGVVSTASGWAHGCISRRGGLNDTAKRACLSRRGDGVVAKPVCRCLTKGQFAPAGFLSFARASLSLLDEGPCDGVVAEPVCCFSRYPVGGIQAMFSGTHPHRLLWTLLTWHVGHVSLESRLSMLPTGLHQFYQFHSCGMHALYGLWRIL